MGTPDFAEKSLEAVYNTDNKILAVVTNPDKRSGRGMKINESPVKVFAEEKGLKIYQPAKVRNNEEFINEIKSLEPDLLVVVAYGKILPKEVLDIPKYGAINVHGSLLPKYRGAAPIQWAVINGDKETGVTTMFMDEGMDTGDMILKEKVLIGEDETTGELWTKLADVGAELLVKTLEKIEKASEEIENEILSADCSNSFGEKNKKNIILNKDSSMISNNKISDNGKKEIREKIKTLVGAEKQENDFTLAPMLNKEMGKINWNKSALEIKNLVRGLDPIMGTYTFYNGKKIKIWKVKALNEEHFENVTNIELDATKDNKMKNDNVAFDNNENKINLKNGEIILVDRKKGLFVKCGSGIISVLELQAENQKRMNIKDFLNGNHLEEKKVLE
jgi:methionyl-tRNA formyltransferase